jgi:hypothetical protein
MSFGDLYTVPAGQGNSPDLPPIDLPRTEAPPRPKPRTSVTVSPAQHPDGAWGASAPEFKSPAPAESKADHIDGAWGAEAPEHSPETEAAAKKPYHRDVGAVEAFGREGAQSATMGLYPAIAGAMSAGRSPEEDAASAKSYESGQPPSALSELHDLVKGLGRLGLHHVIGPALGIDTGDESTKAYDKGRDEAQKALEAGREQHPYASLAGGLAGAVAVPVPGLTAAAAPARLLKGAAVGAAGGAAYGAGSALSEGKDAAGIGKGAAVGGTLGGVTGGLFGGLLGPRANTGATKGQRAAQTAEALKAPIPRGLASDNTALQSTTAALRSFPLAGARVGTAVDKTQHAAGEKIGDIAVGMVGAKPSRAVADTLVRPGLEAVIDKNQKAIDANYSAVRGAIDQNAKFIMPRTRQVLSDITRERHAAGHPNPSHGLDQFINVSNGATFNGAHRARVDARNAGNVLVPHPGYNKADYNRLTKAMTVDIRNMAAAATKGTGGEPATAAEQQATRDAFDKAEKEFGRLSEQNTRLSQLLKSQGQAPLEKIMGAASEKGGNLKLLAQLRSTMSPSEFSVVGGQILHELGHNNATGEFSLSKFATSFDKLSDGAKNILFSPKHAKDIEDIAGLGSHIKKALRDTNTSHTSNVIILFELAKDAIIFAAAGGFAHLMAAPVMAGAAAATPAVLFAHWLSSPATASSMAAWSRARVGMLGHPTPARLAAFNIASRNLANNLGMPVESVIKRIAGPTAGRAEDDQPDVQGPGH